MTLDTWLTFFVAAWAICLSPGPGVLSSVTAGLNWGYRGAVWNLVGLQLGANVLLTIAALGIGTVLAAAPTAFLVVKYAGAAYLVWLGIQQWRAKAAPISLPDAAADATSATPRATAGALVLRGFLTNVSNPKGILFLASVLPQFIDLKSPQLPQYLIVAATLLFTDICSMLFYTVLGQQALRLMRSPRALQWINRGFGTVFIIAGIGLASYRHTV
jgi:homoserine/homoserine lactone efflux protein